MTAIFGNTYPVREQIRKLGGRWDATRRCWNVPDEKADEARRIVIAGPPSPVAAAAVVQSQPKRPSPPPPPPKPVEPAIPVYLPGRPCYRCGWRGAEEIRQDVSGRTGYVCGRCTQIPEEHLLFK